MYKIKQASLRTGVGIPLLRAWERRYGIPSPERTPSGYRLYGDEGLARLRQMKAMVDEGWAPSQAAQAILSGTAPELEPEPAAASPTAQPEDGFVSRLTNRFVAAADALDEGGLERALDEAFGALGIDDGIERFAMPALVAIGEAWAAGRLDVASEHAASQVVTRRLGALFQAAGVPSAGADCLVGLPPGSRHETGALAFAVEARRLGLRPLYLGADVPLESWRMAAAAQPGAAVVLGAVTLAEADSAARVVAALRADEPARVLAVGGAAAARVGGGVLVLPSDLREAVRVLRLHLR